MWLNGLFVETPIDFEKRCRHRIAVGSVIAALGAVTLLLVLVMEAAPPVLFLQAGWRDFIPGFYTGIGGGFFVAGVITVMRNNRYLKDRKLCEKRKIYETDERNRMLGLRSWAYAGYSMFLLLYIGVIVSGFISLTAMKVLLGVAGMYSVLLLIFRRLLQKSM